MAQIHAIMGQYFKANAAMMFMLKTMGYDSSQMFRIPQVLKINCFFFCAQEMEITKVKHDRKFVENDLVCEHS